MSNLKKSDVELRQDLKNIIYELYRRYNKSRPNEDSKSLEYQDWVKGRLTNMDKEGGLVIFETASHGGVVVAMSEILANDREFLTEIGILGSAFVTEVLSQAQES